jgi:predicted HAD superfamily phosphohydrolase
LLRSICPLPVKTWKTHPAYYSILEILKKKSALTDTELFEELSEEFKDLGYKDFNELLMRLEISGRIRTASMVRGKRRIELVT